MFSKHFKLNDRKLLPLGIASFPGLQNQLIAKDHSSDKYYLVDATGPISLEGKSLLEVLERMHNDTTFGIKGSACTD